MGELLLKSRKTSESVRMSEMWVKVASVVVVVVQWIWHGPCFAGQNVINCDSPVVVTNVFGDANDEPMDTGPSTRQRNSLGKCISIYPVYNLRL